MLWRYDFSNLDRIELLKTQPVLSDAEKLNLIIELGLIAPL